MAERLNVRCKFCGYIIYKGNGAHWQRILRPPDRVCKASPMMAKLHCPEENDDVRDS